MIHVCKLLVVGMVTVLLGGCGKNKECTWEQYASVQGFSGPDSGLVNQTIPITAYFSIVNGCGQFKEFYKTVIRDTTIIVNPVVKYEGCVCTDIFQYANQPFLFTPTLSATYYIKFYQDSGMYLVDTVVVR